MSTVSDYSRAVNIPSWDDFAARYPQYKNRARNQNRAHFELIMTASSFLAAETVTLELELPGVAGVARRCAALTATPLSRTDKQFIGAAVCTLMEANGYSKTGRKRAIPHPDFTKGEVYQPA